MSSYKVKTVPIHKDWQVSENCVLLEFFRKVESATHQTKKRRFKSMKIPSNTENVFAILHCKITDVE